jgi:glycosyltransferase involved in cell wall biosynthesis
MKIYADCVVKDEQEKVEEALRVVMPHVDRMQVIDTGSTDDTIRIVNKLRKEYDHLHLATGVDIGPNFDIQIARNKGLQGCPPEFWTKEPTWYFVLAGDEVYDDTVVNIRPTLEKQPDSVLWVFTWGRNWTINAEGEPHIDNPQFGRPMFYRHVDGMKWSGVWNRERIIYPKVGSYFRYEARRDFKRMCINANIWYDHYGWTYAKRHWRQRVYTELDKKERQGKIRYDHG